MKKKFRMVDSGGFRPGLTKIIRIMKITAFLLFFAIAQVLAVDSYSQTTRLSLDMQNETVKNVLLEIEDNSEFYFVYSNKLIDVNRKVNIKLRNKKVNEILNQVFEDEDVVYAVMDRQIILSPEEMALDKSGGYFQQVKKITGTVKTETDESLPGVTVLVKGTTIGTVTIADGSFSLDIPDNAETLVFSFIGMATQEIDIGTQTTFNIVLISDSYSLDEVVSIGYGTMKKSDITGSVSSVSADVFKNQMLTSPEQGLQGRVAGVQVISGSSQPGAGFSIRIRGSNSINGSSEPLYIIDGLPIASSDEFRTSGTGNANVNPLASINPNNIASMEILKDASATAIYGSRGANGVVLITTKRGKAGKPIISFSASYGLQTIAKKIDVFNTAEFVDYQQKLAEVLKVSFMPPSTDINIDWQDELFKSAPVQNYNLSASGGTDFARYSISANIQNQEGIVQNTGFDSYSFSSNVDIDLANWLTWGSNLSASHSSWQRVRTEGGQFQSSGIPLLATTLYSGFPNTINDDGTYPLQGQFGATVPGTASLFPAANPLSLINETEDVEVGNRIYGNTFLNFDVTKDLTFKTSLGVDIDNRSRDIFESALTLRSNAGDLMVSNIERITFINENIATYSKSFNDHSLIILGGYSIQKDVNRIRTISTSVLTNEETKTHDLSAGTSPGIPSSNKRESILLSWLGRVNYNYLDRYLLTLSGRYDGSSKFAENNKWGFFPSAAVAWRIIEEPFLADNSFLSNLKLRASWGITGNQSFAPYSSLARLGLSNYNDNDAILPGFTIQSVSNPDLKWEETAQVDVGLDFGILNGRVNFTFDYYKKKTKDLILSVRLPQEVGSFSAVPLNAGKLENNGFEFLIDANIFPVESKFQWNSSLNFSRNTNKVLEIVTEEDIIYSYFSNDASIETRVSVGQPIGSFFGWKIDGIYNDEAELLASPVYTGAEAGDIKIVDVNKDGVVNDNDRTFIGNPEPKFIYGLNNKLSYKNFTLDLHLQGVQGGSIANLNNFFLAAPHARSNKLAALSDVWTPSNTDAKYPKPDIQDGYGTTGNDLYIIENGSYVRLKLVSLGYKIPRIPVNGIESIRLYVTALNLFTLTNYTGFNPDVSGEVSTGSNGNTRRGIDLGVYPLAKTIIFGFNINF